MTLTVEAALARDQAELEMLEAEIAERRQRIDALKVRVSVLMDVLNAGGPPQAARPADDDADWVRMPRTQAVERMLAQRAPISPQALAQALNDVGRAEDNWERVGRVLDYLRKHSRAKTIGRAQWVPFEWNGHYSRPANVLAFAEASGG